MEIRRLHGRAIERAFQTGEDVISCFHHDEESYYAREKTCAHCKHLEMKGLLAPDWFCLAKDEPRDLWSLTCEDYEARG